MEVKEGYKQTDVGIIPEDWDMLELGEIITYTKGFAFKPIDYQADGIRIVRVSDTTYTSIKDENAVYIDETKASKYAKWRLKENDLIISTVGSKPPMWNSLVGKIIRIDKNNAGSLLNQNAVQIRARNNSSYIQYLLLNNLRTERYIRHIEAIFRGNANQASITLEELFKYQVALPKNKDEQKAIAEALSDAGALIEALEQLIAKKRQVKQGAMQELLTGKRRLPGFSGKWETKKLGEITEIVSGGTPSTRIDEYWNGNINWCIPTDITGTPGKYLSATEKRITELGLKNSSATLLPKGTLLLCSRATIGDVKIAADIICTNQGFKSLICSNQVYNEFLYYVLLTMKSKLIEKAIGSTFLEITKREIALVEINIPSVPEQRAIAEILSDMDAEIAALEAKLVKARHVKQGVMQELLTGRIRLV